MFPPIGKKVERARENSAPTVAVKETTTKRTSLFPARTEPPKGPVLGRGLPLERPAPVGRRQGPTERTASAINRGTIAKPTVDSPVDKKAMGKTLDNTRPSYAGRTASSVNRGTITKPASPVMEKAGVMGKTSARTAPAGTAGNRGTIAKPAPVDSPVDRKLAMGKTSERAALDKPRVERNAIDRRTVERPIGERTGPLGRATGRMSPVKRAASAVDKAGPIIRGPAVKPAFSTPPASPSASVPRPRIPIAANPLAPRAPRASTTPQGSPCELPAWTLVSPPRARGPKLPSASRRAEGRRTVAARTEAKEDLMEVLVEEKPKLAEQRTWPRSVTISPDVTYARASSPRPMSPRPAPKPVSMTPATGKSVRCSDIGTTPAIFRLKAEFQAERELRERQEREARLLSAKQDRPARPLGWWLNPANDEDEDEDEEVLDSPSVKGSTSTRFGAPTKASILAASRARQQEAREASASQQQRRLSAVPLPPRLSETRRSISLSASSDSCGQLSLPVISSLTRIIEVLNKENQELKGAVSMLEQLETSVTEQYKANVLLVAQLQETAENLAAVEEKLILAEENLLIAEKRVQEYTYNEALFDRQCNRILDLEDQLCAAERGSSEPVSENDDEDEGDEECPDAIGEHEECADGIEKAEDSSGWDSREPTDVFVVDDNSDEFF